MVKYHVTSRFLIGMMVSSYKPIMIPLLSWLCPCGYHPLSSQAGWNFCRISEPLWFAQMCNSFLGLQQDETHVRVAWLMKPQKCVCGIFRWNFTKSPGNAANVNNPFGFFWSFQKLQIGPKRNLGVVVDLLMIGAPQLRVGEVDDETKGVQSLIPHPSWLGSRLQPGFLSPSLMDCFGT